MRPGEGQNRDVSRHEREAVEKALRAVGDVRSILDVGAGNGRWSSTVASKKPRLLVAFDLSRKALLSTKDAQTPASSPPVPVCGDAGALPFSPQSFDLVICLNLLPHVRRSGRLRALREMRRVSSRWVVVEYAHTEGLAFAWQRLRKRAGFEANFPRNHLTGDEIQSELRRAGLGIRGIARVGGMFSRSWVVLAEAPSADWMRS